MASTQTMMRVRGTTKERLRGIAKSTGWTIAETAERAAAALTEKVGDGVVTAQVVTAAAKHRGNRKRATSAA